MPTDRATRRSVRRAPRRAAQSATPAPDPSESISRAEFRWAVLIGLALVAAWCVVIPYTDLVLMGSELAVNHLPVAAVVTLAILLGGNVIARTVGGVGLTGPQVLIIYAMVLCAAAIPSTGLVIHLLPTLVVPEYYATPVNDWHAVILPYVSPWLVPHGDGVATWFFEGLPAGASLPWGAWLRPLGVWTGYVVFLVLASFSIGALFRRPWIEEERLTFPLADIPLTDSPICARCAVTPLSNGRHILTF